MGFSIKFDRICFVWNLIDIFYSKFWWFDLFPHELEAIVMKKEVKKNSFNWLKIRTFSVTVFFKVFSFVVASNPTKDYLHESAKGCECVFDPIQANSESGVRFILSCVFSSIVAVFCRWTKWNLYVNWILYAINTTYNMFGTVNVCDFPLHFPFPTLPDNCLCPSFSISVKYELVLCLVSILVANKISNSFEIVLFSPSLNRFLSNWCCFFLTDAQKKNEEEEKKREKFWKLRVNERKAIRNKSRWFGSYDDLSNIKYIYVYFNVDAFLFCFPLLTVCLCLLQYWTQTTSAVDLVKCMRAFCFIN